MKTIAVIVGSARQGSINQKLSRALQAVGKDIFRFREIAIDDLPIYNQDDESAWPEAVARFHEQLADVDGVLFLTPEHNRSITALLKNAIDWGSRPYGAHSWLGRPAALAGVSYGVIGTAAAQQHLRAILAHLDMTVLGQPELFLAYKEGMFGADGAPEGDDVRQLLTSFLTRFSALVEAHGRMEQAA